MVLEAADELSSLGIDIEVIDVQSLTPFDLNHDIRKSIEKMAASDGKTMVDSELYAKAKAARGR